MSLPIRLLSIALAAFGLAGCATPASRIQKNAELFATFPPEVQEKVRQGQVAVGFSPDMVRIALGTPDRTYVRTTAEGTTEVWSYTDYRYTYNPQMVRGTFTYRDASGHMRTAHDNIWADVETREEYEKLRVEFRNGLVAALEEIRK